jgi:ATP-dependent RNA helicase DDX49/DBP8
MGIRDVELVHGIEARVGRPMEEYVEDKVNVETRVLKEALNFVGQKKREVILSIEEGRDVKGNRKHGMQSKKRKT